MDEHRRPDPDPTVLTTEQLHREMSWVKQMITEHVESERAHLAERKALFLELFKAGDNLVNQRIDGVLREMHLVGEASKVAVAKSEAGYEKRFESVNEFRAQLSEQAAKFITAAESRTMHSAANDKIAALTDRFNRTEGRDNGKTDGKSELRSNVTGAIGILVGLASLFLFLSGLSSKVDRNTDARITTTTQSTQK